MAMKNNRKAEATNFGSKTNDYFADNQRAFSVSDSTTDLEPIASIIERMMRPGKVIRLYRCFACNRCLAASRMSAALVVCRACLKDSKDEGRIARHNRIDRITNDFRIFLRGRLEVK